MSIATPPYNNAFLTRWYSDCQDPTGQNETDGCWGNFRDVRIPLDFTGRTCYVNPFLQNHMFWFEDCSNSTISTWNTTSDEDVDGTCTGWVLGNTVIYVSSSQDSNESVPYDILSANNCTDDGACRCDSIVTPDNVTSYASGYLTLDQYGFYKPEENVLMSTQCAVNGHVKINQQKPVCEILGSIEADPWVPSLAPTATKMPAPPTSGAQHALFPLVAIYYCAAIWSVSMAVGRIVSISTN